MVKYANNNNEWAKEEFGNAILGDKRLTNRLVGIANNFTNLPESSINQSCGSWSETKAAYRFFQNENIKESDLFHTRTCLATLFSLFHLHPFYCENCTDNQLELQFFCCFLAYLYDYLLNKHKQLS